MRDTAPPHTWHRRLQRLHCQLRHEVGPHSSSAEALPVNSPPIAWGRHEWRAADARQCSILLFDSAKLAAATKEFDREAFLRDGYWLLPGIMTEETRSAWSAALRQAQKVHDTFIVDDWREIVPWAAIGLTHPSTRSVPPAQLRAEAQGRSQELPHVLERFSPEWHERGDVMRRHGLIPEYFLSGYVPFLMDVAVHPEMEALHRRMLFSDGQGRGTRVLWNHCHLLSRAPGYPGGSWHSHPNRDGTDGAHGIAHSVAEYERRGLNVIFTFAYPDGFVAGDSDGGLKVVPGSHLFRDPDHCRGGVADAEFAVGWMQGKSHPVTGNSLEIKALSLPPGSLVSVVAHLAHGVSSRAVDGTTRFGSLWSYRVYDPLARKNFLPSNNVSVGAGGHGIPPSLQHAAVDGHLPERIAQLIPPLIE